MVKAMPATFCMRCMRETTVTARATQAPNLINLHLNACWACLAHSLKQIYRGLQGDAAYLPR